MEIIKIEQKQEIIKGGKLLNKDTGEIVDVPEGYDLAIECTLITYVE
ncbi:hypothetical protein ACMGE9_12325 [Macrococcus sp. EM39E]